jgi:hypothetical protein
MMKRLHPRPKIEVNNIKRGYCTTSFETIRSVASMKS